MKLKESKLDAFKRLAVKRTNRILKNISLLGNLSDKRNYSYNPNDVTKIFHTIDDELKDAKARFDRSLKTSRSLEL